MPSTYMVDVGERRPALILADNPKDAAFQAMTSFLAPVSGVVTVVGRTLDGETETVRLVVADRKCRVCGCTENKACHGGCCWMGWDICSRCIGDAA